MRGIAFFSQKGGVDETTASMNSTVALAARRVLPIDPDSHACASAWRRWLALSCLGVSRA